MSSYKKYLVLASFIFLMGCTNNSTLKHELPSTSQFKKQEVKEFKHENQYIIYALEYEHQHFYKNARKLYFDLFSKTNKYEYLSRYVSLSFYLKDYETIKKNINVNSLRNIKEEESILRLYIFALLKLKENQSALVYSKKLVEYYPSAVSYELLANVYLELKKYDDTFDSFKKSNELKSSLNIFASMAKLQYYHLNKKIEAKKNIQEKIKEVGFDYQLSILLLSFYEKEELNDEIISLLKDMYFDYKEKNDKLLILKTKNLLIGYLSRNNIINAIDFLEKNNPDDMILLSLYRKNNQNKKAYDFLEKLYKKSNNLDYLAQQAILEFEIAKKKEDVIDKVINKFDKVLKSITNATYQNYLAYLLIDYNRDIKRGLVLVKKALDKQPDNIAFLDTLAWGEFKLNNCEEAYIQMKRVIDISGLDDEEIKKHWKKIKECKK